VSESLDELDLAVGVQRDFATIKGDYTHGTPITQHWHGDTCANAEGSPVRCSGGVTRLTLIVGNVKDLVFEYRAAYERGRVRSHRPDAIKSFECGLIEVVMGCQADQFT